MRTKQQRRLTRFFGGAFIAVSMTLLVRTAAADEREEAQPVTPTLSWMSDLDEALEASKKSGKPILLEFR